MDMGKSSEARTSGGEPLVIDYEVFLSFRGPDTRKGFTDCLYHNMLEANISVFLDEEELHVGKKIADELPTAIEKSKIYIPIFSKGYASSAWCLRELAHMVEECTKSKASEKEIMPIFYDVEPRDVKMKESQLYIGALDKHEKEFGLEMRLKWEDALKTVAHIKGWELKDQGYWKFIKSMIEEILMKLKTKDKLVSQHLVGMDDPVKDVEKLLDVDSQGMRVVLIHGMGGIGKTTLAKVVFNKLNSHFSHCCFVQDVRQTSLKSLETLQKRLLSIMFGSSFHEKINDVDDGIKEITKRISNKKVLIVLDDVDNKEQLEKLAINHISFGSGSRLIMTTRDRSLIVLPNQTLEYEVKPLDSIQSFDLFNRHAFRRNPPPDDYVGLSTKVVSTAGGLPLALEVIGSLLYRQKKASWMDVLDDLRVIPNERVEEKLKISYNALNHKQKQIFLDIACLFLNEDQMNAIYMWKDCGYGGNYSIDVLVCRSLIKITDDHKFWMHDQLRDLGRKIVCEDTPSKQSRLWVSKMANNIIRTEEIKEATEAICLEKIALETYTSKEFSRLPNLRFLKLCGGQFDGDFENQLSELRYLSWYRCPRELLAINFHPRNLVVLNLSYSSITENWAGWSEIKVAKKLKVLDLMDCFHLTKTPDFSHYTSLERLILKNCQSLIEVDGSLDKLKCLIYFSANWCTSLRELPEGIGWLEKLEYLYLGNCRKLEKLPESFKRVASLVELDLSYTAITRLPDSIGSQHRLSVLKLQYTKINELPSSIGNLRKLKSLDLSFTKIRELPVSIGNLESLLELDVSHTKCLRLPESIGDLSRLKVINISHSSITELPRSIGALKELEELYATRCWSLKWEIPEDIWELSLLRVLDLKSTPIGNVPATIKLLPHLEKLELCDCGKLEELPELPTSLIRLSFGSSSLRSVPNLSSLTKLADLAFSGRGLNSPLFSQDGPWLQFLTHLPPSLSTLSLKCHKCTTSLSFHCNLRNLTYLLIHTCRWKEVQVDGLEQLIEFKVITAELLKGFAGLSRLKRLKQLTLINCPNLTAIQGLGSLESLEQLHIDRCPKIESLDDLSDLKKLASLRIEDCYELLAVKGLDELEALKILIFVNCRSLRSFPSVLNWKVPDECTLLILGCPNLEESFFGGDVSEYKQRKLREERGKKRKSSERKMRRPFSRARKMRRPFSRAWALVLPKFRRNFVYRQSASTSNGKSGKKEEKKRKRSVRWGGPSLRGRRTFAC
ncbi:disease resistance protein RPV1-like [Syzygium oleosum]|uniref:disease resistance protein RPV1-like n=1 Tax=Syzygium oleosum TaxID=219896 RepID=UPI0024BB624C|nr:disease resistance protein RPV1-like [Syzygium oleosum]